LRVSIQPPGAGGRYAENNRCIYRAYACIAPVHVWCQKRDGVKHDEKMKNKKIKTWRRLQGRKQKEMGKLDKGNNGDGGTTKRVKRAAGAVSEGSPRMVGTVCTV
jgi:hypothetical protein